MKKTKIVLFMLLVFWFCILGFAGEISKIPKLAVTVIDVDNQGYFDYHGKVSKLVNRGQEVIWICNTTFTIYFGNQSPLVLNASGRPSWGKIVKGIQSSPFNPEHTERIRKRLKQLKDGLAKNTCKVAKMEINSRIKRLECILKKTASNKYQIVQAWISNNTLSGKYKYIIAAFLNGKIWIDDPEDIVDPPRR